MIENWLDLHKDSNLLMSATMADAKRINLDQDRLDLNAEAAYDAGFEAGVLATEAGVGRAADA